MGKGREIGTHVDHSDFVELMAAGILALAVFSSTGLSSTGLSNTGASVAITDVQFGFDGRYKIGDWFPIAVTIQAADQPVRGFLSITVPDSTGAACDYVRTGGSEIQLAAGQSRMAMAYIRSGRVSGQMHVRFTTGDGQRVQRTFDRDQFPAALLTSQRLIVGIGPSLGCRKALVRHPQPSDDRVFVAEIQDARGLPDQSCGYAGVDVIVLTTSELELVESLSPSQWQAIDEWVRLGGKLILTMGVHGDTLLAPGQPLADLAPGRFVRVSSLRETGGLESYAGSSQRLDLFFRNESEADAELSATLLDSVDGVGVAFTGRGQNRSPLLVHGPHGFGRVVFVAIDLDNPPIDRWAGQTPLVARLLELALGPFLDSDDEGPGTRLAHVGYEDLTGQLRMALDQFRGVRRLPFLAIAGLAIVYILLIGPGDYFFVRQVLRRVESTWVTFPLLVLLFGGMALWLARQPGSGSAQTNQLEIVDLDSVTGTYRGSVWSHLYSRNAAAWNVAIQIREGVIAKASDPQGRAGALVSWQGLPGTGFGGMHDSQRNSNSWQAYSIVGEGFDLQRRVTTRIENLPMSQGGTRSLFGRWWRPGPVASDRKLDEHADETLSGTVTNPWGVPLQEAWLVHGRWYYPLGTLAPGESAEITSGTNPRSLKSLLARRRIVDSKDLSTPWDKESADIRRLVEMLMFHEAAGGRSYTSLRHRHQQELDFSTQLTMGRAVLVGQSATPATQWLCQPKSNRDSADPAPPNTSSSFLRVLLPVNSYERNLSS